MTNFKAGFAQIEWTPAPGLNLLGQMHERIATHARDPLCTCAAVFQTEAATLAIVTLDVGLLDNDFAETVQRMWADASGFTPESLMVHCTHTHVAPNLKVQYGVTFPVLCVRIAKFATNGLGIDVWRVIG